MWCNHWMADKRKEKDEMTVHRRWHIHDNVWCTLLEGILSYPFTSFLIHPFVMVDAMPIVCEILRDKFRSCCNTIYTFLVKTNNGAGFLSSMSPSFPACSLKLSIKLTASVWRWSSLRETQNSFVLSYHQTRPLLMLQWSLFSLQVILIHHWGFDCTPHG